MEDGESYYGNTTVMEGSHKKLKLVMNGSSVRVYMKSVLRHYIITTVFMWCRAQMWDEVQQRYHPVEMNT